MILIPDTIKQDIKDAVFRKADEHDYMNRSRPENRRFMQELIEDGEVGTKLASYMEKSQIKTYIKDGILNQYAKSKLGPPEDLQEVLRKEFGVELQELENLGKRVCLYAGGGVTYVVACGTYLKWESALRKALQCAAALKSDIKSQIVLVLSIQTRHATAPDMNLTKVALERIGVKCIFARV